MVALVLTHSHWAISCHTYFSKIYCGCFGLALEQRFGRKPNLTSRTTWAQWQLASLSCVGFSTYIYIYILYLCHHHCLQFGLNLICWLLSTYNEQAYNKSTHLLSTNTNKHNHHPTPVQITITTNRLEQTSNRCTSACPVQKIAICRPSPPRPSPALGFGDSHGVKKSNAGPAGLGSTKVLPLLSHVFSAILITSCAACGMSEFIQAPSLGGFMAPGLEQN